LLIRRSLNLSLHPGEIAFPGGKLERGDADLRAAAQREAWEEVALAPELFVVCGELTPRISAWGLGVTAVVGVIPPGLELRAQASEVDELIWAPLDYFVDSTRLRMDRIWRGGVQRNAARYQYLHYTVWGMTAGFIVELVNRFYNAGLETINQAPAGQRPLLLGEVVSDQAISGETK
jgi:8-oxo-dGTP pyrophosphatase MutT (NUDIX family)